MFSFQGTCLSFQRNSMKPQLLPKFHSISLKWWWRVPGSNRWPPACKAGALPAELTPHIGFLEVVGQGLAFLRKSHGGCNSPPDCCQEPPFESILACSPQDLDSRSLDSFPSLLKEWWAKMDSNHRPHDYQSCALASWAIGPYQLHFFFRYIFPVPSKLNNASTVHLVLTLGCY